MAKSRWMFSGRCRFWAAGAFGAFAVCALLSSLPTMPEFLKVGLAVIGYVALILLLGCALRAWRDDWSEIWFLPRKPSKTEANRSARGTLVFRRDRQRQLFLRS